MDREVPKARSIQQQTTRARAAERDVEVVLRHARIGGEQEDQLGCMLDCSFGCQLRQVTPDRPLESCTVGTVRARLLELRDDLDLHPERRCGRTYLSSKGELQRWGVTFELRPRRGEHDVAATPLTPARVASVGRIAGLSMHTEARKS